MNMKTSLFALGLLVAAGALTISCGGSDDGGNDNSTAGTTSTAGNGSGGTTAGSSSAGNASGGTSSSAGTSSSGGTSNSGGTNPNGGTNNNSGGDDGGPDNNGGDGNFPGFGGDGNIPGCPATQPTAGEPCQRNFANRIGCPYDNNAIVCECAGQQGNREWDCGAPQGQGGGDGGFGDATCPADAMTDQDCTGAGPCPGQQGCFCNDENVYCLP